MPQGIDAQTGLRRQLAHLDSPIQSVLADAEKHGIEGRGELF